jgi:hypothetical protein
MKTFSPARVLLLTASLAPLSWSPAAVAANRSLNDRFQLFGGMWFVDQNRKFTIEGPQPGDRIKLDIENLGLDTSDETGMGGFLWRISQRFRLEAFTMKVDNSDTATTEPVVIGGVTLVPGGSSSLSFSTDMAIARLGFSFIANEQAELGVSLGGSWVDAEVRISANLGDRARGIREQVDGVIPTVGMYGAYALSETWSLHGRFSALNIEELGNLDKGSWVEMAASVVYRPFQNVGFGLAYKWLDADAESSFREQGVRFEDKLEWDYRGPFAFIEIGLGSLR